MTAAVIASLATLALFVVLWQNARLEKRVEKLERVAHPPVDVRPAMRMVVKAEVPGLVRAEVERVLEEHVP